MTVQYAAADGSTTSDVTPELVLVDPALGEHARAWLPDTGDTLRRIERRVHAHRIAASRAGRAGSLGVPEPPAPDARELAQPAPARSRAWHRRSALLAAGLSACALSAALLVGVRVELDGNPASADTAAIGEPPTPVVTTPTTPELPATREKPKAKTPTRTRPRRAQAVQPEPRRFAWAPAAGASGYHIELFRGSTLVFSADTPQASVSVPPSWRLRGTRRTLEPGQYRWYVWPLISGRRAAGAIVQATLEIPSR